MVKLHEKEDVLTKNAQNDKLQTKPGNYYAALVGWQEVAIFIRMASNSQRSMCLPLPPEFWE